MSDADSPSPAHAPARPGHRAQDARARPGHGPCPSRVPVRGPARRGQGARGVRVGAGAGLREARRRRVGLFGSSPASFQACGQCSACQRAVPRDEERRADPSRHRGARARALRSADHRSPDAGDAGHLHRSGAHAGAGARGVRPARRARQGLHHPSRRGAQRLGGQRAPEDAGGAGRAHPLHPADRPAGRAPPHHPLPHPQGAVRAAPRGARRGC